MITTWRLELKKILVFDVRFLTSAWPSLTQRFQTELRTHATVPDINQGAVNKHLGMCYVKLYLYDNRHVCRKSASLHQQLQSP